VAALTGVLALATLPSGGPADGGQLVLAVSGGVLALVVLVQAHQTARAATGQAHRIGRAAPTGHTA